ncbi:DMT family transporter [Anaerotignum sp.]|uniref:DMT family transporter n=1 Tax=Anaerotignum sp. TaxID=2039241 RepID=UPI0028A0A47C|nr:DMT family transporter [Anaerotignum sp.]
MRNKGDWMLLIAAILGGGGFIGVKYLLDWGYTPYQVMLGRFLIATVCLSLIYFKRYFQITKKEWKMGGILGVLLAATFVLLTVGLQYTTPSVNAFLCNTQAAIVPFICWGAFRQKPLPSGFLAAFLTLFGVALLSVTEDFKLDIGAVLSFGAAVDFSMQMAFMGKAVQECDSVNIALVEHLAVTVISFVITAITGFDMPSLNGFAVASYLNVGIFCTAIYFVLQSVGQKYTSANKTAIIITSESIFAAIISVLFYGERMGWRGLLGCGIIFAAMLLAEKPLGKTVDTEEKIS